MLKAALLSTSPEAKAELDSTDYSLRLTLEETLRGQARRRPRIFADGVFDIFHFGHARLFKHIRELVPDAYIIAGVNSQEDTEREKGPAVMTDDERVESVLHCRYVDEVIPHTPWALDWDFIDQHKIDFVAHDALLQHFADGEDIYGKFKDADRFIATQRTEAVSTTLLISRIVANWKKFEERNKQRLEKGNTEATVKEMTNGR